MTEGRRAHGDDGDLNYLAAGRVAKAHGVRGRLRVIPSIAAPERSLPGREVFLQANPVPAPDAPGWLKFTVESAAKSGEAVLLKLKGLEDRAEAERLVGSYIFLAASDLPALAGDSFYIHRLCRMEAQSESGDRIGLIRDVWETPAHPVLVVESESGEEVLIPFIRTFIRRVDEEGGRVVVADAPGFLET